MYLVWKPGQFEVQSSGGAWRTTPITNIWNFFFYLSPITLQSPDFIHWIVPDIFFRYVTVKTIYQNVIVTRSMIAAFGTTYKADIWNWPLHAKNKIWNLFLAQMALEGFYLRCILNKCKDRENFKSNKTTFIVQQAICEWIHVPMWVAKGCRLFPVTSYEHVLHVGEFLWSSGKPH